MTSLIDTHVHLNQSRLLRRLEEVLTRATSAGVSSLIVVGYDLATSELAVRLAQTYPQVWATVGVHPHDAQFFDDAMLARLRELAG